MRDLSFRGTSSLGSLWTTILSIIIISNNNNNALVVDAQTIPQVLESTTELGTFYRGVEAAGLTGLLASDAGPYTVFGPDNVAMAFAVDEKYYEPQWKAHLTEILLQHVSSGEPAFTTDLWEVGIEIKPLSGGTLTVTQIDPPSYQLNNVVNVLTPDIVAPDSNDGVIHIVDTVVLPPSARDSIMDIITVIPDFFSTLESLLIQTGLDETLRGGGPYTLFAPSNEAFNNLNPEELVRLQSDTNGALTQLLEYHICPGIFLVETLQRDNVTTLPTLQGTPLPKPLDNAQFVDLLATNGAMHIVDKVLFPPNGFSEAAAPPPSGNISQIVIASNFTLFVTALNKTGWLQTLQQQEEVPGGQKYTVFAVPDDGFDNLPTKFFEDEVWNGHLTNVITYHIIPQVVTASNLTEGATIDTLNFNSIEVTSGGDPIQINGVNVTTTDIVADNGVVHVLEEVLLPPSATDTALDLINGFDQFSILYSLINSTGLQDVFNGTGPITAIAPIDEAFNALPEGTLDALAQDPAALRNILLYHVAPELIEFVTLSPNEPRNVTTEQSSNVTFEIAGGVPRINGAQVLFQDLLVQNGIVQVIDTVLIPPERTFADDVIVQTPVLPTTTVPTGMPTTLTPTISPTVPTTTVSPTIQETTLSPVPATAAPTGMPTILATTTSPTLSTTTVSPTITETTLSPITATTAPTDMPTILATTTSPTVSTTTVSPTITETTLSPVATTAAPTESASTGSPSPVTVAPIDNEGLEASSPPPTEGASLPAAAADITIMEFVREAPSLSVLHDLIMEANLASILEGPGPITLFAPADESFDSLPDGVVDSLLNDPDNLQNLLLYHVIGSGAILSSQLEDGKQYPTGQGANLTISIEGNNVMVDDAKVILPDLVMSNGVLHFIDSVLLPTEGATETESPTTKAPTNPPTEAPVAQPTEPPTEAPVVPPPVPPPAAQIITVQPSGDCVTIPGQTVCCPPGETTGLFFFCRYL